jgi:hypothetical protein
LIGTRHLGIVDVMGRKRVPNPAAKMIAFMGKINIIRADPGEPEATRRYIAKVTRSV